MFFSNETFPFLYSAVTKQNMDGTRKASYSQVGEERGLPIFLYFVWWVILHCCGLGTAVSAMGVYFKGAL